MISLSAGAYARPQGWFNQTANVEVGYRILPESNTKITADYSFNAIDRTNAQVEHSTTNTESLQLSSMLGDDAMGRISYEHADRSGELIYGTAWGNLESGDPELFGTPSGAYYQAPMTSDSFTIRGSYAPAGDFSASLFLKYANEHYDYPAIPATAPAGDWNLASRATTTSRSGPMSAISRMRP